MSYFASSSSYSNTLLVSAFTISHSIELPSLTVIFARKEVSWEPSLPLLLALQQLHIENCLLTKSINSLLVYFYFLF